MWPEFYVLLKFFQGQLTLEAAQYKRPWSSSQHFNRPPHPRPNPPLAPPTQWCYFLGFIACTVAAWALRDYGASALDFSPVNDCLADTSPPDYGCMGQQVRLQACCCALVR